MSLLQTMPIKQIAFVVFQPASYHGQRDSGYIQAHSQTIYQGVPPFADTMVRHASVFLQLRTDRNLLSG